MDFGKETTPGGRRLDIVKVDSKDERRSCRHINMPGPEHILKKQPPKLGLVLLIVVAPEAPQLLSWRKLAILLIQLIWKSSSPTITLLHSTTALYPSQLYFLISPPASPTVLARGHHPLKSCAHWWMKSRGLSQTWPEVVSCRSSSLSCFRFALQLL
jgi:hypothetical protein